MITGRNDETTTGSRNDRSMELPSGSLVFTVQRVLFKASRIASWTSGESC